MMPTSRVGRVRRVRPDPEVQQLAVAGAQYPVGGQAVHHRAGTTSVNATSSPPCTSSPPVRLSGITSAAQSAIAGRMRLSTRSTVLR